MVYQHDSYDREKQARANQVVWRASAAYGTAVTNQVLADFASIVIRPRRQLLPPGQASAQIERLARQFVVLDVTGACVIEALRGVSVHQLAFREALIWAVARLNQVAVILTEDLRGAARHSR